MALFDDLAVEYTKLDGAPLGHLKRLVGSWGLLADFCFSDLLLFVPVAGDEEGRFVIMGQMRPTTGQTLYREDMVGLVVDEVERPMVSRAWRLEEIIDGDILSAMGERARSQCIPVRWRGLMLGVLTRDSAPSVGRKLGELELTYLGIFEKFARMVAEADFPFPTEDVVTEEAPRVGDGVLALDVDARVEYVSPNAISVLHRLGIHANAEGMRLSELGMQESAVRSAFAFAVPVTEELERREVVVAVRCIPLLKEGAVDGAVVLMRDISDLRRRDRLLVSKDATIREVHHRVKNNLQTISSLLRLQGRRLESSEAKVAIEESVRRIRSIALVHETLSRDASEQVEFNEIVRPLVRMVEESLLSPDRPVQISVEGEAGELPAEVATPLAVVLTELLQNAVDHAFGDDPVRVGHVDVTLSNDGNELVVLVRDDGSGLPPGFDPETAEGLGLTIVRALVTTELGGTLVMRSDGGTLVELRIPVPPGPRLAAADGDATRPPGRGPW